MELYLVYIHEIGFDHEGKYFYEFIFSDSKENIDSEENNWGDYPASGNPTPPNDDVIKQVGKIELDNNLLVAQNNEQFSMWDAVDGVIPLAWENIDGLEEYPQNRLVFPFGMLSDEVTDKLYERDIRIKYKNELKDK
jgi:hypothetical protein|tara:strand:- start:11570 stop:11980 length:411 start_codon:yes stop_codon:yes gene_type:complete